MKSVHKTVLIWHSAHEMFALVTDVSGYPQFLPWCSSGEVLERTADGMVASIGMSFSGIKKSFTTRNTHVEDRRIHLELVDGPFSHLDGTWDLPKAFRQVIADVRQADHCIASEEHELGVFAVAVPLRNLDGKTVAALNAVVPHNRLQNGAVQRELLPLLQDAARELRPLL